MDGMLCILIGLAAGLAVGALAPEMSRRSPSESVWRRVRSMAAGAGGAVSAGYGMPLFQPSRTDNLTTALAAVAGALWITGIVEVYASRRQHAPRASENPPFAQSLRPLLFEGLPRRVE